jgi:hypothetical protein
MNPLLDLFITTFKVGALTFGGGYAMIPVLQHEFVDVRAWLTAREFADGIAVGQITPGPLMIMVAFMGYKIAGIVGALIGTIGLFGPTFILVILVGRDEGNRYRGSGSAVSCCHSVGEYRTERRRDLADRSSQFCGDHVAQG